MSGRLPAPATLSGDAGVRQEVPEVRRAAHGGLRCPDDAAANRGRAVRRSQRAGTRRGEPATGCATLAGRRATDPPASAP